jgi:cell division protein FtsZ
MADSEEAIERWAEKPRVLLVGLGGAGCDSISDIEAAGLPPSVETLAINTDGRHLQSLKTKEKLLIGELHMHGRGSGGDRGAVQRAAMEQTDHLKRLFRPYHMIFFIAGLGGGTGSALLPICVSICQEVESLAIPVAILPFEVELESNPKRRENAREALREMDSSGGFFLVLSNEKLRRFDSQPIRSVFQMRSTYLRQLVLSVVDMVEHPSEINVDLALVSRHLQEAGLSTLMIAYGHMDDPEALVRQALNESFLDFELTAPGPVLIHVEGGSNLSLRTHQKILEAFRKALHNPREFVFGTRILEEHSTNVRVTVMVGRLKANAIHRLLHAEEILA